MTHDRDSLDDRGAIVNELGGVMKDRTSRNTIRAPQARDERPGGQRVIRFDYPYNTG